MPYKRPEDAPKRKLVVSFAVFRQNRLRTPYSHFKARLSKKKWNIRIRFSYLRQVLVILWRGQALMVYNISLGPTLSSQDCIPAIPVRTFMMFTQTHGRTAKTLPGDSATWNGFTAQLRVSCTNSPASAMSSIAMTLYTLSLKPVGLYGRLTQESSDKGDCLPVRDRPLEQRRSSSMLCKLMVQPPEDAAEEPSGPLMRICRLPCRSDMAVHKEAVHRKRSLSLFSCCTVRPLIYFWPAPPSSEADLDLPLPTKREIFGRPQRCRSCLVHSSTLAPG